MTDKENKDLVSIKGPEDQPDESENGGFENTVEEGQAPVQHTEAVDPEEGKSGDGVEENESPIPQVHEGEVLALLSEEDDETREAEIQEAVPASGGKGNLVWPIVSAVLGVLLIVALVIPLISGKKVEAVATVNGSEITKDQLYIEMSQAGGDQTALEKLITKELINQEAKKQNIVFTEADIDKELKSYLKDYGSEENLNQALIANGMTMEQLRENIQMNKLLTKLLEPQVEVTDEQIKQTFEDNKAYFDTPEQVRASVILVKTEAEANEIIKELNEGKDFAELAKSKSLDEATKANGGDTDFFARGQMEEAVENAAFKLAKDELSSAVKTEGGYQVIKLTDRKEAHNATLEEKKEEIREGLVNQQVSQLSGTWIQDIRSKATITNTLTDSAEDTAAESNTTAK
ncbi:foldase protein PrsA [Fontibacillus phaseoli]|uniref:peptidylprolyl isomerase n=1 Tax=Fontibacillus phaseoli TaxID=1416533 RepID=A0A369BEH5_9BACL|nr:peptidylprolyl isomerase [Fontibacillus phaseoli]RCX19811.1 foldase protein PrsA [Fontibacillus phaseoli]